MNRCHFPRCRRPPVLTYLDRACCAHHWKLLAETDDTAKEQAILSMIKLERLNGKVERKPT